MIEPVIIADTAKESSILYDGTIRYGKQILLGTIEAESQLPTCVE